MSDFDPEIRNSALWSSDSRRIASGDACAVVLEKLGRTEPEDVSGEEVDMGHIMEPVIAAIFEERHGCRLKEFGDLALTHREHSWLRSHFDYQADDGSYLVECKNYNANYINYFSEPDDPVKIPDSDYAQCLHEAIVANVNTVYLAVLFGGQRYREYRLDFTEADKLKWINRLAEVWGNIQTNNPPPPSSPAEARDIWPQDDSHSIVANKTMEVLCHKLAGYQTQHKENEKQIEWLKTQIMAYMGSISVLVALDGRTLATWKQSKTSKRFNADLLKSAQPETYDSFCVETEGSRRFLVK